MLKRLKNTRYTLHIMKHNHTKSKKQIIKAFISTASVIIFLLGVISFSDTKPHDAELRFAETSEKEGILGGMLPASCESGGNNTPFTDSNYHSETTSCVWTEYCTYGNDVNGNYWQVWAYSNEPTRFIDYKKTEKDCKPKIATNLATTCNWNAKQMTVNWSNSDNSNRNFLKFQISNNQQCPSGWATIQEDRPYSEGMMGDLYTTHCTKETTLSSFSIPINFDEYYDFLLYPGDSTGLNFLNNAEIGKSCSRPVLNFNFNKEINQSSLLENEEIKEENKSIIQIINKEIESKSSGAISKAKSADKIETSEKCIMKTYTFFVFTWKVCEPVSQ